MKPSKKTRCRKHEPKIKTIRIHARIDKRSGEIVGHEKTFDCKNCANKITIKLR